MNSRESNVLQEKDTAYGDDPFDEMQILEFEEQLQKFNKHTLTLFISLSLDPKHFPKVLHLLGELESLYMKE